ncbi:MAG: hypothetical protein IKJ32_06875 [Clostridia bacterium]|nr:hypothetical protein [Clostridia bacterium]
MKKRLFIIIFLVVFIAIFLMFFQNDTEKILFKNEVVESSEKDFQVYLNDDCIYFYDEKGNAVIYNFSGDKISEAFMLITVSSVEEAESVKNFYLESISSGDVKEIIAEENLVTIVYNDAYVKALEGYTKQDIEAMLQSGD